MTSKGMISGIALGLALFLWVGVGFSAELTINPRAERYFSLLARRPGNEQLFDRFYEAWLDSGTPEGLERFLKEQVDSQPSPAKRLLLAFYYARQGRDAESLDLFSQAAEGDPLNGELLFLKAQAKLNTFDLEGAIADLERVRSLETPADLADKSARLLGRLYVRNGQQDQAKSLWQDLLRTHPSDEYLFEDLIELQVTEGLYEEAIATSDRLLAITRDSYRSVMRRLRKGDILHYAGRNEEALVVYADSLALAGHDTWVEDQICSQCEQVFRREDNLPGLRAFYRGLIEKEGQRLGLKKRLARLLLQMDQTEEALALFREILKVTPGDQANQQAYVKALVQAGQLERAIDLLLQMTGQYPDNRELHIELAELYDRNEQDVQAAEALRAYLAQSQRSEQAEYPFLRVTRLFERYGQLDEAGQVYRQLLERHAESLTAKEAYAGFLFRGGREEEALALWETIAQSGDLQMLIRAAQAAAIRDHREASLDWLEARYQEFAADTGYLSILCNTAIRLRQYDRALPWARRQLALAQRFSQIKVAMGQVVTIAERQDRVESMTEALAAQPSRTIQETCLLSDLYESLRMSTEADALLTEVPADEQETALRQRIRLCRLRRDWSRAAELTQSLLNLTGGRDSLAIRDMVDLYRQAHEFEAALAWIPRWKRRSPGSVTPWLTEAQLLGAQGKETEAMHVLRAADQAFDGHSDILSRLAQLYTEADLPADAQRLYWRLFDRGGRATDKLRWIRDMARAAGTDEGRERIIERLKERRRDNPSSVVPHLALAEMYRQTDRYEQRRQALLAATRIQSQDVDLLYEIARIETSEGDWELAIETLTRALPYDDTQKTRRKIALLHIQQGNEEEGYRLLADLAGGPQMDRRDAEALADTMCAGRNWALAVEFLEGFLDPFPGDYRLRYLYAVALEEEGRDLEAMDAFVALLSLTAEIPGHTGQPLASPWAGTGLDLTTLLPEDAQELMTIKWLQQRAYRYRTTRRPATASYAGSSATRATVLLPPAIEDLSRFALCHIVSLGQFLDGPDRTSLQERLTRRGVRHAEVLMDLGAAGLQGLTRSIEATADRFPDNRAVQAIWITQKIGSTRPNPERCRAAFALFEGNQPHLALLAGLKYAATDGSDPNVLAGALKLLPSLSPPGLFALRLIIALAQQGPPQDSVLSAEVRDLLSGQLRAWYPQLKANAPTRPALFAHIAGRLIEEDPAEYVRFLDAEISRVQRDANAPGQWSPARRSGGRRLVERLIFPPRSVPGVPDPVTRLLMQGLDPRYSAGARSIATDPNRLLQHVDQADNDVLRVLILLAAARLSEAEALLTSLLATEDPSLATFMLAAGVAAEREQPEQVLELLERARPLVISKATRRRLDGAMVAYALDLHPDRGAPQVTLGQKAALRLRGGRLSQAQLAELSQAMDGLELSREAALLARRLSPARPSRAGASPSAARRRATPQTRVQALFTASKTAAALRLLWRDLQTAAANSLYPRLGSSGSLSQEARWLGLLHANRALDAFMELADPGQTGSVRKLVEFGRISEILDDQERAQEAYERALSKRPGDVTARVHLAILLGATDPARGAAILATLNPHVMNQVGPALVNLTKRRYRGRQVAEALDIIAVLAGFVRSIEEPAKRGSLDWLDPALEAIVGPCIGSRVRLSHLYQLGSDEGKAGQAVGVMSTARLVATARQAADPAADRKQGPGRVAERRLAVHADLCRAMVALPQVSAAGFSRLAAVALARREIPEDLPLLAQEALLRYRPRSAATSSSALKNRYSLRNRGLVGPMGPAEFLIEHSRQGGALATFAPEFAARLRDNQQGDQARQFEQLAALYLASPDAFTRAGEALLKDLAHHQGSIRSRWSRLDALVWILDTHAERQLDIEIEPFLLEQIEEDIKRNPGGVQPFVRHCLLHLAERGPEAAQVFLEGVVTLYVGPKAERTQRVETHYDRRRVTSGSLNARIHHCFGLLRKLAQEQDMFFWLTAYVEEMPPLAIQIRSTLEMTVRNLFKQPDPNAFMVFLKSSPFLADADRFSTLPVTGLKHNSLYACLIRNMLQATDKTHEHFRDTIHRRVLELPWTLGTRLMSGHLSDGRAQAVHSALGYARAEIQEADRRLRRELALMVTDTLGETPAQTVSAWNEEAAGAHAWMATVRLEQDREQVSRFMAAKDLRALNIEDPRLDEHVWQMVERLSASDPARAKQVLLRAWHLVTRAEKRGQWRYQPSHEFVTRVFAHGAQSRSLGQLALVADLIRDANTTPVLLRQETIDRQVNTLQEAYQALRDEQQPDALQQMQTLYEQLGDHVGRANLSGLTRCFAPIFAGINPRELDGIAAWAETQISQGPYPGVAREIRIHAELARLRGQAGEEGAKEQVVTEPIESIISDLESVLTDTSLSVTWRLMALDTWLNWDRRVLPDRLIVRGVSLLSDAWNGDTPMSKDLYGDLLQRFTLLSCTEAWDKSAAEVTRAYNRQLRRRLARRRSATGQESRSIELALLKINLLRDHEDSIKKLTSHQSLATHIDTWALLIEHRKFGLARSLMRAPHQEVLKHQASHPFSATLERHLSECLTGVTKSDLRYYLEVRLSSLADGTGAEKPRRARAERLERLAARFADLTFRTDLLERQTLLLLCETRGALPFLTEALAKQARRVDLGAVCRLTDSRERTVKTRLVLAYAVERLMDEDPNAFLQAVKQVVAAREKQTQTRASAYSAVLEGMARRVREVGDALDATWDVRQVKALARVSAQLVASASRPKNVRERAQLSGHCLLFHALAGSETPLEPLYEQIHDDVRGQFVRSENSLVIWQIFARLLASKTPDEKMTIVKRYFSLDRIQTRLAVTPDCVITLLKRHQILTEDEILAHGTELATLAGEVRRNWETLADLQEQRNRIDEADRCWLNALDLSVEPTTLWRGAQSYCAFLQRQGRHDQARAYLSALPTEAWSAQLQRQHQTRLEQLTSNGGGSVD